MVPDGHSDARTPMDYLTIKTLHHAAVALSAAGFLARGTGMLMGAAWVRQKPARTLPHIVDTVLLATGVTLAVMLRIDPLQAPWLGAKLLGLLAYIGLGMVALRPGRPRAVRASAWLGALLVLSWMVSVALTKDPGGWLRALL